MLVQLEGVHLLPILKVAICSMNMKRLDRVNRPALTPAGPNGKKAQKNEGMLRNEVMLAVASSVCARCQRSCPCDSLHQSLARPATARFHIRARPAACTNLVCSADVRNLRYGLGLGAPGMDEGIVVVVLVPGYGRMLGYVCARPAPRFMRRAVAQNCSWLPM